MATNINSLSKATNNPLLKQATRELITSIMGAIVDANENGKYIVEHNLPVSFVAGGINKADAQLIVWTDVITALRTPVSEGGKGFKNVKLVRHGAERFTLVVTWDSGLSMDERNRRMEILRAVCVAEPAKQQPIAPEMPTVVPTRPQTPTVMRSPVTGYDGAFMSPLSQWRNRGSEM